VSNYPTGLQVSSMANGKPSTAGGLTLRAVENYLWGDIARHQIAMAKMIIKIFTIKLDYDCRSILFSRATSVGTWLPVNSLRCAYSPSVTKNLSPVPEASGGSLDAVDKY
jgi:hypothetical protein